MRSSVCPALTTAAIVHGLSTDHDRRRGQRCTVLTHPVSLIHRGISVQINRATSLLAFNKTPEVQICLCASAISTPVLQPTHFGPSK
jgi:hypothetical protein